MIGGVRWLRREGETAAGLQSVDNRGRLGHSDLDLVNLSPLKYLFIALVRHINGLKVSRYVDEF